MDRKLERSNKDKVLRRFTHEVKVHGYRRTKPSFFVREADHVLEFLHIHKYSFAPCFRMHACIRVLNESSSILALAGDTETELSDENIKFEYGKTINSVECCVDVMSDFVIDYVEPWFAMWRDRKLLLESISPLYEDQKCALDAALKGNTNSDNVLLSKSLLKIA